MRAREPRKKACIHVYVLIYFVLIYLHITYESAPLSLDNLVSLIYWLGDPYLVLPAAVWILTPQIATVVPDARFATVVKSSYYLYIYLVVLLTSVTEAMPCSACSITSVLEDLASCGCHLVFPVSLITLHVFYTAHMFI